ncbi:hypothetical protein K466DRAFT_596554 [Polyporus arcularius HHB13444]|uniref:BAG domain-containing protein n=1 Tax=Polyporus arcularius HHB13444 TaxID=1314778 RepID=A0A5C3PPB5_9APHY|nr:hypothetical protein K466DRAFT_596554 [Polyporus arcularius HHB13444]
MLVFSPSVRQPYLYSQDAFSEAAYYESVARQAAQNYAVAHARVQAIQRQRERESYYHRQAQAAYMNCVSSARPRHDSYPQRRPSMFYSFEELALSVQREEERCLAREQEAQRHRALEAERRARALQAEQERRRAQEAEATQQTQEQEAILAFLGMMAQVATQVHTPQPGPSVPVSAPEPAAKPVDRKGKGKAIEVPIEVAPVSAPVPAQRPQQAPSLKEELEARIRTETDPDVQESLVLLYSDLFDARRPADPVAGPSKPTQTRFRVPVAEPASSSSSLPKEAKPTPQPAPEARPTPALHRNSVLPPAVAANLLKFYRARRARKLSLGAIKEIEDALRKLEEAFEFPEHLDFANPAPSDATAESDSDEPGRLAYSSNNTPIHAYEHALNVLLTRLDAVESNGDLEVRGRRKEVVKEVERALEVIERRVEESRERSRERRASSVASVEAEAAPAVVAEEEVKGDAAPAAEPPAEAAVAVDDTSTAPVTPNELAEDVPSRVADSTAIDAADAEPPSAKIKAAHDTDSAAAQDAPVVPSAVEITPSPTEVTEAPVAAAMDDVADVATEVPLVASASEYFLPPVSISSPTPDTQAAEAISRIASSATDTSDATFATADTELTPTLDDVTKLDTQGPKAISRIASSATDTTDATFMTADTELPPASASSSPIPEPNPEPMTRTNSSASEEAFLLSSSPLADEPKRRRTSDASAEDGLEIISKEELEVAKNDSDWSDLDSDA